MTASRAAIDVLQRLAQPGLVQVANESGQATLLVEAAITDSEIQAIKSVASNEDVGACFWEMLLDAHINVGNIGR